MPGSQSEDRTLNPLDAVLKSGKNICSLHVDLSLPLLARQCSPVMPSAASPSGKTKLLMYVSTALWSPLFYHTGLRDMDSDNDMSYVCRSGNVK